MDCTEPLEQYADRLTGLVMLVETGQVSDSQEYSEFLTENESVFGFLCEQAFREVRWLEDRGSDKSFSLAAFLGLQIFSKSRDCYGLLAAQTISVLGETKRLVTLRDLCDSVFPQGTVSDREIQLWKEGDESWGVPIST